VAEITDVSHFAYLVRPAFDQAFMASAGERERIVVDAHSEYLLGLQRDGKLIFAGRCFDGPFAIVVFEAADEREARSVMTTDPSILAGVQKGELYPFEVGLIGAAK
jgi:uncharacterized protein